MKFVRMIFLAVFLLSVLVVPAGAHEGREVGPFVMVFGWRVEPAYTGQFNGPELIITLHDSKEPVRNAEKTLSLEVGFGPLSMSLPLRPVPNAPGHYTADLIPTVPGDYRFHLTGSLGRVEIDEVFSSADGEFSTVEPVEDIMFPKESSTLQGRIDALQQQIDELKKLIDSLQNS